MTADVLDARARNRATLARQLLLERVELGPEAAIAHLVGLQSQVPNDPYTALWSRLRPFDPHEVGRLLTDRRLVRTWVMRGTIHLVTADDALTLRAFGAVLVDGMVRASWRLQRASTGKDAPVTMIVRHVPKLPKRAQSSVIAEGRRLLRFLHPDAGGRDVRLEQAG